MKSKHSMRNKFFSICMMVFMMLFIISCSSSDSPPPTYNISGAVSGATLSGVTINLTGAATATATTDANGNFSFTGRANGTYTVIPVKTGYIFNPVSMVVVVSGASVTDANSVATTYGGSTYSISGTVTGAASSGVTITLSGANTGSVVTGIGGTYAIAGLVPGSYTATPSLTGFTFSPTSTAITITSANSTGNNFVATALQVPHSISGTITALGLPLSGVNITVTGKATATATTNTSGVFNVTGLYDGDYTVTPSKSRYTFSPVSLAATVSGADLAGKDFTANPIPQDTYTISGTVSGAVLSGVTISLSGSDTGSTITNTSGNYSFSGIANGSYTVTPSLTGYTFSPASSTVTVSEANVTVPNFVATAVTTTFTQADLTGTWNIQMLRAGSSNGWLRGTATADSSGLLTLSSCLDSTGSTGCPAANSMQWTINGSGVISESGVNGGNQVHMTMTSNKNFIAGTGSDGNSQLRIAQKLVPGTVYTNADVQSKSFVIHGLSVGGGWDGWQYAAATTDSTGLVTITSGNDSSSGPYTPGVTTMTVSVNSSGIVTMSGKASLHAFLSADKKTIVSTDTSSGGGVFTLSIFQITGQTYTAGPLPAGTSAAHMLTCGSTPAPFWLHFTSTVDSGGVITASDWASSNSGITNPGTTNHGFIDASGTVTITENPTFHGQVSDDGKFTVATRTFTTGAYSLQVSTK